jgi:hypothetical protein
MRIERKDAIVAYLHVVLGEELSWHHRADVQQRVAHAHNGAVRSFGCLKRKGAKPM